MDDEIVNSEYLADDEKIGISLQKLRNRQGGGIPLSEVDKEDIDGKLRAIEDVIRSIREKYFGVKRCRRFRM